MEAAKWIRFLPSRQVGIDQEIRSCASGMASRMTDLGRRDVSFAAMYSSTDYGFVQSWSWLAFRKLLPQLGHVQDMVNHP
ncbi:MAG: hypothetical protein IJ083_00545 [Clostridia bacterium]|nr:hypothetical protein [Clostridia bacterium]